MSKTDLSATAEIAPAPALSNGHGPIPNRRLPSDDFTVTVDGTDYHPHAGEWLEVGPTRTLRQLKFLEDATAPLDGEGSSDYFKRLWAAMTAGGVYLLAWNWTANGQPLPPVDTPDIWLDLTDDECLYVVQKVIGGWKETRPLPNASPDMPPG